MHLDDKNSPSLWLDLARLAAAGLALSLGLALALGLGAQICFMLDADLNESLVEWLQFAVLLGGALVLAVREGTRGRWLRLLAAAGFFVLAMEEIDWAQPYLGYAPLPLFADHNPYHEMALHNAFGLEHVLRKAMVLGALAGGAALLASVVASRGWSGLSDYIRRILLWPGALFGAALMVFMAGRIAHPGDFFGFDEFAELAVYSAAVWFALSRPLDGLRWPGWQRAVRA